MEGHRVQARAVTKYLVSGDVVIDISDIGDVDSLREKLMRLRNR